MATESKRLPLIRGSLGSNGELTVSGKRESMLAKSDPLTSGYGFLCGSDLIR